MLHFHHSWEDVFQLRTYSIVQDGGRGRVNGLLTTYLNLIVGSPQLHGACTRQVPCKFLKNSSSPRDCSQRMTKKEKHLHRWITRTSRNPVSIIIFVIPWSSIFQVTGGPLPAMTWADFSPRNPQAQGDWTAHPPPTLGVLLFSSANVLHPAVTEPLVEGKI